MTKQPKRYNDFADFLKGKFPYKMQKISVNAGFTCPNRDGTKGEGGCTYCNNQAFSPAYCRAGRSVRQQLEDGIFFFSRKYPDMRYLAYFQSYTNTYGRTVEHLIRTYEEALAYPGVEGLIIATRPDCMTDELLYYLARRSHQVFILVEYGVESTLDFTLERINRGHTWRESFEAILLTGLLGIHTGAHVILGLPGESRADMLRHALFLSPMPLTTIKLHQLQLIRHTRMGDEYEAHPERFRLFTADEYVELVIDFLERISPSIAIDRFISQSPKELLIAPDWGLKNHEFTARVNRRLLERDTRQGLRT